MENDPDLDRLIQEQLAGGRAGNWELYQKPRPFHRAGRLVWGVFLHLVTWGSAAGVIYTGVMHLRTGARFWLGWCLAWLIIHIVGRVLRYSNGLRTTCPLCHGTPLLEKSCRKHRLANKFLFFGHRTSSVLSILFRGRFNCMYCGTPFRLKK